ncbi:ring finger protein [Anaeramoeba flamelloides]|uniref:Ring finger protein n=1 Tax=Anaeramoeba flamelloides TaxID=1746091 RepID=A0ABQ8YGH0_9EUKA|nr:ring finger protein [Anaeramoeba flamelloides]
MLLNRTQNNDLALLDQNELELENNADEEPNLPRTHQDEENNVLGNNNQQENRNFPAFKQIATGKIRILLKNSGKQSLLLIFLFLVFFILQFRLIVTIVLFEIVVRLNNISLKKSCKEILALVHKKEHYRNQQNSITKAKTKIFLLLGVNTFLLFVFLLPYLVSHFGFSLPQIILNFPIEFKSSDKFLDIVYFAYFVERLLVHLNQNVNALILGLLPKLILENTLKLRSLIATASQTFKYFRSVFSFLIWFSYFSDEKRHGQITWTIKMSYLILKLAFSCFTLHSTFKQWKNLLQNNVFVGSRVQNGNNPNVVCSICEEQAKTPVYINCNHSFCHECIYLVSESNRTCPLCQSPIYPIKKIKSLNGTVTLFFSTF